MYSDVAQEIKLQYVVENEAAMNAWNAPRMKEIVLDPS